MSGLGRAFAEAQARWDHMAPPEGPTDDQHALLQSITWAEEVIGRAERAIWSGDLAAARDLMREAAAYLTATED